MHVRLTLISYPQIDGNANLWVYCNEDSFWFSGCKKSNTGAVVAYEQEDAYFNNWYITFCPIFYDEGQPLDDVFKRIREKQWDANVMENYDELPLNQAHTFFHETMHLTRLTVEKYVDDAAYGAENVYKLAHERNADISTFNADSWAYTALAILAQNEFKLEHPPYPYKHPRGQAEIAESSPRKVGSSESVVYKTAKDKDLKSHENPDLWETWSPGPVPQCQGETAFSQPAAEKAIDAFCSDPDHNKVMLAPPVSGTQKVKNRDKVKAFSVDGKIPLDGSELDLHFQVSINEGGVGNGAFDFGKDMCSKMMNIILNGCDNQTIDKKLGGYIVNGDSSGIYRMAAKPKGFTGDVFPKLKSNDDRSSWQWKCEDTDNSKVFFDWQKNSCTCRYLELGGLIDWFAKPDGDGCSRIKGGEYTIPLIEFV